MAHANEELIARFYQAFDKHDADGVVACYGPGARFEDAVFGKLDEREVKAMWRMLCGRATDLRVTASGISADDTSGRAHWDAVYTWKETGRLVRNSIDAVFTFRDGKIVDHKDSFSLRRWIGMALGPVAGALGWLPPLQNKVRKTARGKLDDYLRKNPA
jgi:ketosteroid isomerase-like protein